MAKKAVATLHTGNAGRNHTKCIKMVKSPKTGAYIFQEEIVENEKLWAEENGKSKAIGTDSTSEMRSAGVSQAGIQADLSMTAGENPPPEVSPETTPAVAEPVAAPAATEVPPAV